jgi:chromosome transmission fidelity protein 18
LQFIKSKTNSVTEQAVKSATVGSKDAGTTLNAMWNSLFVPVAVKQRRKGLGLEDGKYVNRLAFQVQACGDYDKVVMGGFMVFCGNEADIEGCFEHYPNLKPIDGSLGNVSRMHHWLGFYDRMSSLVNERQEYELMAYLPYAVVPWHSHFAAPANSARPTEWPKADYEVCLP